MFLANGTLTTKATILLRFLLHSIFNSQDALIE